MRFWGKDEERGALLGAIGAIILFTFVFPDPDVDLGVVFPGNPPYGFLWKLFNPFYWTKTLYPMIVFAEWAGVTSLEWWLAKKGFLNSGVVKLQIFSVAILLMLHATQDVTVIMFAPLGVISLAYISFEIAQKIPAPGTVEWQCAFNGSGTDANAYLNPCLSNTTHFFTWNHIYWITYPILILWVVLPLILHLRSRKLLGVGGGRVGKDRKIVERGRAESKVVSDPQTISKQPALSPTKSVSLLDVLLLLTVGVIAHDFASYYGFHINGLHAFDFAIPMVIVILFIKFERRLRRWKR